MDIFKPWKNTYTWKILSFDIPDIFLGFKHGKISDFSYQTRTNIKFEPSVFKFKTTYSQAQKNSRLFTQYSGISGLDWKAKACIKADVCKVSNFRWFQRVILAWLNFITDSSLYDIIYGDLFLKMTCQSDRQVDRYKMIKWRNS